ncbi:hypothetical protein [Methylobacterium oxalidis]|uniref:hypothetical protein n=1 Tax=Methylobacterium oxalidis TaxID=944322 RepID=UPI0033146F90
MAENPTVGDLFKAKALTDNDVRAAVDAYMADPTTSLFVFGDGYGLDLAVAVRSHAWAAQTVFNADATEHLKRAAVRTAILLARPERR